MKYLGAMIVLLAGAFSSVGSPQDASVSLSTNRAGARPVTVTLRLRYEMQCGNPGPGSLVVSFPDPTRLPSRISAASVLLDGRPAPAVSRTGSDVTITLPRPHGTVCDVIAPGRVTVVFTSAARFGNPARAGLYPLSVRKGKLVLRTTLKIRSA